jgi:histidine ammonia-lyase
MSVEALLGTDASSPPTCRRCARTRAGGVGGEPARAAGRQRDRGQPPRAPECTRVQDAYSLRCAPQVHGARRDTVEHAARGRRARAGRAIDNPVVTLDGRVESNGNFHGAPVGYVLDFLAIAVADVASSRAAHRPLPRRRPQPRPAAVPRRRPRRRLRPDDRPVHAGRGSSPSSSGSPVPASVDSIPSSAMQEDHVSMGWAPAASCAARSTG